jgi:hypothetical protein
MESNNKSPVDPEIPTEDNLSDAEKEEIPFDADVSDKPAQPKVLTGKDILEKNIGIVKYHDYLINNSLNFAFQRKLLKTYRTQLVEPIVGSVDAPPQNADKGRLFLRDEYFDLKIEEETDKIIEMTEDIARKNGIRTSMRKLLSIVQMIFYIISIGAYFILASIDPGNRTYYLIGSFAIICAGPYLVRKVLQGRWDRFQKEHGPEIMKSLEPEIDNVKRFIQDVLDDTRDRLLNQSIPLDRFQFVLLSESYQNLKFVRSQAGAGDSLPKSVFQFEYPPGMQPVANKSYGASGIIEDDTHDEFLLLQNPEFSDDGEIVNFHIEIANTKQESLIENLLNVSKFQTVTQPELVMPNFDSPANIACSCGDPIHFDSMKTCVSPLHSNFEFYLIIGHKCGCGKKPYILVNSPGNESVPEGLKPIFG